MTFHDHCEGLNQISSARCSLCTNQVAATAGALYSTHPVRGKDCECFCLLGDHGELALDGQISTSDELPDQEEKIQ
jgi:hypothetical protein